MKKCNGFFKKIVSLLLVFSMTLAGATIAIAAVEYTSENYTYTVSDKKATITAYPETATGTVNIPSTLDDYSVVAIGSYSFYACTLVTEVVIPDGVAEIGEYAFAYCTSLKKITIPDSVESIGDYAFYGFTEITDIYYTGTESEWNAVIIGDGNERFTGATIHYNFDKENIYNLGEETYSFDNFGDYDSRGGHCFGMSATSAGYYIGELDVSIVGIDNVRKINTLTRTETVKAPICYYHKIQGYGAEYDSIVAGGSIDLHGYINIESDWKSCVNYVKNHEYDNTAKLNIGMWYADGGHAVNFLYYKEVDGQQRIYAYDNNFPNVETYYYMGNDGYVHQAPVQTSSESIIGFDLMDVEKYFSLAKDFKANKYIYADKNEIFVEGADFCYLKCGPELSSYVMYQIPQNVTEVKIVPKVDNATFTYCENTYSFGSINSKTYGILKISTEDSISGEEKYEFSIKNGSTSLEIKSPSNTTISYGDSIILHANVENLPAGGYVVWTADNGNFSYNASADGSTCKITPKSSGTTTFTATVYDKDGNVVSSDTQQMKSKAGVWEKIIGFFKSIFGLVKTYPESFKDIF